MTGYKSEEPMYSTLRAFSDRPYSSKASSSSDDAVYSASSHSHSFYLNPDVVEEDGSYHPFSNHLEPIEDLFLPNWSLYHGDPLEGKETNVIIDPERTFSDSWSSSPDSVDSDLDDESPPPCTSQQTRDDDEDNDHHHHHMYYPSPPSTHDIYHHLEESKYPAHLYTPDQHALLPLPPPPSVGFSDPGWTYPPPPPFSPDAWGSRASLFDNDDYSFALHDPTTIPCSPSRRTSRELPEDADDHHELQRFVRLRSLPGAETDDDLIPTELASKNYIPDPSILVPTTAPRDIDGLLLWDLPSQAKMNDANDMPLQPTRSPSPEEEFTLDPDVFAELAGQEVGVEMRRIQELRERTGGQSWERERVREISALLRLKMRMLGNVVDHERSAGMADDRDNGKEEGVGRSEGDEQESTSISEPCIGCSSDPLDLLVPPVKEASADSRSTTTTTTTTPAKSTPSKPKITNMAQLVANMVFHRQQPDHLRRPPPQPLRASRTWGGLSSSSYGNTMPKTHRYPTPRSPLRQVSLPSDFGRDDRDEDNDEDGEDFSASSMELFDSPLPLSPLVLTDSPLGLGWLTLPL